MGYARAGFEVVGVDHVRQPRYPFAFVQGDALAPPVRLDAFDAIHASPPCQVHTALRGMWNAREHVDLVPATRALLRASGLPSIIENVPGAPLRDPIVLCGSMFGLGSGDAELRRHRLFEVIGGTWVLTPSCAHRTRARVIGVYGDGTREARRTVSAVYFNIERRREAMGIDWMIGRELSQAIPPAYTEHLGAALRARLLAGESPR